MRCRNQTQTITAYEIELIDIEGKLQKKKNKKRINTCTRIEIEPLNFDLVSE